MAKAKDLTPVEKTLHRLAQEADGQGRIPDFDPDFSASFPNLWAFLTWAYVGDLVKDPGSVTIKAEGTGWKVSYFDPAAERGCAVLAGTLMDGLRRLEAALVAEDTLWTGARRKSGFRRRKDGV